MFFANIKRFVNFLIFIGLFVFINHFSGQMSDQIGVATTAISEIQGGGR